MESFKNFDFTDQSQIPENLPIFPLPNVVLFPNMFLPLHIFEPRYKKLVRDCLAGNKLLGIILLRRGWENEEGDPTPYEIGGMGQITKVVKLPNGNMNILVQGLLKVKTLEYLEVDEPYRIAKIEGINDQFDPSEALTALTQQLTRMYRNAISFRYRKAKDLIAPLNLLASPQDIAYFIVSNLQLDAHEKQLILETVSGQEQIRKLIRFLMRDLANWN
jgi:Lon protease-like protein